MKSQVMYVELKSGNHNGPAWIGRAFFSRSGKTVYFNGKAFHRGRGIAVESGTGDYYWISGVKKNGEDRHWSYTQKRREKIGIDRDVVAEYLEFRKLDELPGNIFEIVSLDNRPPKEELTLEENLKLGELEQTTIMHDKYAYAIRNKK